MAQLGFADAVCDGCGHLIVWMYVSHHSEMPLTSTCTERDRFSLDI